MYHIGSGALKGPVQREHQRKKRATRVERDLKALSPQPFAEYAESIEAVD
jgi:hypothetical protein